MANNTEILDHGIQVEEENSTSNIPENQKMSFPYERSVYIKGILAVIFVCSLFGFWIGLYLINISLKRSAESLREHKKFPHTYKLSSLKKIKQGRNAALIALGIWILEVGSYVIIYR